MCSLSLVLFSSRGLHTRCALVTGFRRVLFRSSAVASVGRANKGRLSTQEIDLKAWDRANAQMVDSFIETSSDLLSMLTKDSVIAARARAEASAADRKSVVSGKSVSLPCRSRW